MNRFSAQHPCEACDRPKKEHPWTECAEYKPLLRAAIYARVSTSRCERCLRPYTEHPAAKCQDYKGQRVEVQLLELREYAARRRWSATLYEEPGISGAKARRPELDRMMKDCKAGRIDIVVVAALDRLGRSLRDLVNLAAEFDAVGIGLVSLRENIDSTTPQGRLIFHFFSALAEFERALIQQRVRAGIALARAEGKQIGRKRLINAKIIATVAQRRAQDKPWQAIAKELGVSRHTCRRAFLEACSGQKPPEFRDSEVT